MKNIVSIIVAVALALVAQNILLKKDSAQAEKTETAYERVMRTGTIRCGYTPYSIGFMKDPNTGKMSGIYYDIVSRLAENLNLKVVWAEEVGWGEQIAGLNAKRYDMMCSPTSLNSGRARSADFSVPLYYSPVHIWAKQDRADIPGDLKALDNPNLKISTLDGEQTSVFAEQFFPKAQQVSLPQSVPFSDLVMQVTTGKADIVFAEPLAVYEFMRHTPDSLRQVTPASQPLVVVPNVILLPRGEYEFKQMIDNGLREMFNSRLIDKYIDAYETFPNSYIRETARR